MIRSGSATWTARGIVTLDGASVHEPQVYQGSATFRAQTRATLIVPGAGTQEAPYVLHGSSGVVEVSASNPWFYLNPTFDGSLTMSVTDPIVDGTFTVYDSDFDEMQVDDDGELGVILTSGVPVWILFETDAAGPLEFTWTYAQRASSQITVTLERDRITDTPGAVSVNIGNGNPDDEITFSILGPTDVDAFATAKFSRFGDLTDYPIRLPALDAGYYLLRVETDNTGTEDVPFTVLEDGLTWGGTTDEDPIPPVVDVQRWTFYDVRDSDDNWTLQRNPSSWSNMLPPNDFTHASTVAVDGQVLTWQAGARPWRMSFQGWIDDEDEYNRFVRWCDLRRRIWLIDHRNRPWLLTLEHFDANHVIKIGLPWAHEYTVEAVIFKQGWS